MRTRDKISIGVGGISIVGSAFLIHNMFKTTREGRELRERVSVKADTDGELGTSHAEWTEVYEELGLSYNAHSPDHRTGLSNSQMRTYLANHQQDSPQ